MCNSGWCILEIMKTSPLRDLGHIRKSKGLSQTELARRTGIVRATLSRIENGRIRPSLDEVRWIAQALGVPEAEITQALERMGSKLWTPKSERISQVSQLSAQTRSEVRNMIGEPSGEDAPPEGQHRSPPLLTP